MQVAASPVLHSGSVADNCLVRNEWLCPLYVTTRSDQILAALQEHVTILLVTLVVSVVVALPLGVLAHRTAWMRSLVLGASTVVYTIPSLAMFSLLLPVVGFDASTVVVALVLYSLTVLVRGLVAGLDAVPTAAVDAATGMGYGRWRLLREVELPLALPTAFASLRIAAVSTVALTTIGFLFDSGGLGNLIYSGLTSNFRAEVLIPSIMCVVLALLVDAVLVLLRRQLTPWRRGAAA
ncbi:ABC transporter permease [Pseudokineococcus marinus]|uniref:ABC transporter permease n=1 Tax=Pseudokineococcus marinus TaxID=351215 RepID=A0A849BR93_9ACTN|nr:ABC transporter permease [Pseudokineococcus marinus]NNH23024.1 ABC transporter permease [Pseudokineococcus marinus]